MATYLLRRILLFFPTLIGATMLVFFVVASAPGGIAAFALSQTGDMRPEERRFKMEYLKQRYGLDKPLMVQYLRWLNKVSPVGFRTWQLDDPIVREASAREAKEHGVIRQQVEADVRAQLDKKGESPAQANLNDRVEEALRRRVDIKPDAGDVRFNKPAIKWPDFGDSFARGRKVGDLIAEAMPITLLLQVIALPIEYLIAILTGIWAAKHRGKMIDMVSGTFTLALWSLPVIWIAVLVIGFLANQNYQQWFPSNDLTDVRQEGSQFFPTGAPSFHVTSPGWMSGWLILGLIALAIAGLVVAVLSRSRSVGRYGGITLSVLGLVCLIGTYAYGAWFHDEVIPRTRIEWPGRGYLADFGWHLVLPIICIAYANVAFLHKLTRAALLETIQADFVRTARAKGLSEKVVLYAHAFRNSLIPLITVAASLLPLLITGSIVVETVFGINGMGKLTVEGITQRDRELFLSNTLVFVALGMCGTLLADIGNVIADPRVSYDK
jgi:peptide/nickel transport system permease protein